MRTVVVIFVKKDFIVVDLVYAVNVHQGNMGIKNYYLKKKVAKVVKLVIIVLVVVINMHVQLVGTMKKLGNPQRIVANYVQKVFSAMNLCAIHQKHLAQQESMEIVRGFPKLARVYRALLDIFAVEGHICTHALQVDIPIRLHCQKNHNVQYAILDTIVWEDLQNNLVSKENIQQKKTCLIGNIVIHILYVNRVDLYQKKEQIQRTKLAMTVKMEHSQVLRIVRNVPYIPFAKPGVKL